MKQLIALLTVFVFSFTSNAQRLSPKDSIQIHSIIEDWNTAWEIKNYSLAAKWYSNDCFFINAFGDKRRGRNEVESLLKDVFSLPFVMSGKSETTEHRYQVLMNNLVIVHTAVTRRGQQMPDGSVLPDRMTTHLRVFQQEDDGWKIKSHLISDARDKQSSKH